MKHPLFTDEHEMFREQVRKFVLKEIVPHVDKWEEEESFPNSLFEHMGELGFLGAHFPEEYGGSGLDYLYNLVLLEELARCGAGGIGMAVSVQIGMATPPIVKFGTHEQKEKYIRPAAAGKKIACLCITEPGAGSDVASVSTKAEKDGDEWVLNGRKTFITNGVRADFGLVIAKTSKDKGYSGFTTFIVDKDSPGFEVARKLKKLGMHCSDTAELVFENCRVPDANVVGKVGEGFKNIMWELQGERIVAAVGCVARAEECLRLAIEYTKERVQFGQPIAKFQAVQHRLADVAADIEAARQLAYNVAADFMNGGYPVKEISMAKLIAAKVAFKAADEALQFHGGYGYMDEYLISRLWRDLRLVRIGGGSDEIMREIIAKEIGLR